MKKLTLEQLGMLLKQRRGGRGLREVAAEAGISAATWSRVEAGKLPDLDTFALLCRWLEVDAGEILGCQAAGPSGGSKREDRPRPVLTAHFRAAKEMRPETARHLGELILAVQQALESEEETGQ